MEGALSMRIVHIISITRHDTSEYSITMQDTVACMMILFMIERTPRYASSLYMSVVLIDL